MLRSKGEYMMSRLIGFIIWKCFTSSSVLIGAWDGKYCRQHNVPRKQPFPFTYRSIPDSDDNISGMAPTAIGLCILYHLHTFHATATITTPLLTRLCYLDYKYKSLLVIWPNSNVLFLLCSTFRVWNMMPGSSPFGQGWINRSPISKFWKTSQTLAEFTWKKK